MRIEEILALAKALTLEEIAETVAQLGVYAKMINDKPDILLDSKQKILPSVVGQLLLGLRIVEAEIVLAEKRKMQGKKIDVVGVEEVTQAWVDQVQASALTTPGDFLAYISPDVYIKLEILYDAMTENFQHDGAVLQYLAPLKKFISALRYRALEEGGVEEKIKALIAEEEQEIQLSRDQYHYDLHKHALIECNRDSAELAAQLKQLRAELAKAEEMMRSLTMQMEMIENQLLDFHKKIATLCEEIVEQDMLMEKIQGQQMEKKKIEEDRRKVVGDMAACEAMLAALRTQLVQKESQYEPFLEIRKMHTEALAKINRVIDLDKIASKAKQRRDQVMLQIEERDKESRQHFESRMTLLLLDMVIKKITLLSDLCHDYKRQLASKLEAARVSDTWLVEFIFPTNTKVADGEDCLLLIAELLTKKELKPEKVNINLVLGFQKYKLIDDLLRELSTTKAKFSLRTIDVFDPEFIRLIENDLRTFQANLLRVGPELARVRDEGVSQSLKTFLNSFTMYAAENVISPRSKGFDFMSKAKEITEQVINTIDMILKRKFAVEDERAVARSYRPS